MEWVVEIVNVRICSLPRGHELCFRLSRGCRESCGEVCCCKDLLWYVRRDERSALPISRIFTLKLLGTSSVCSRLYWVLYIIYICIHAYFSIFMSRCWSFTVHGSGVIMSSVTCWIEIMLTFFISRKVSFTFTSWKNYSLYIFRWNVSIYAQQISLPAFNTTMSDNLYCNYLVCRLMD